MKIILKNNLIQRIVTGTLYVTILTGAILYTPVSFGVLFIVITSFTLWEFSHLINKIKGIQINQWMLITGGIYLFLAFMFLCQRMTDLRILVPYFLLMIYLLVRELYLKRENPTANWAYSILSQFYIALPYALLNLLAFHYNPMTNTVDYHPMLPLSVFIFIWLSDTGAYCTGSFMGKHKLFERISPKKSWEGFIGGSILAIASSFVFAYFFPEMLSIIKWAGLALTVVVFGTWGDLMESLLKRQLEIKDSGKILPGHGGMLDRFDSTLLAIPAAVIYLLSISLY
ncbi:Phosphatidate cytidylyltransferase [termite gut metagenome]|uniref:Phosphatidate cytidylyltransferase n=1 Tax=termite gut metagenome TaxID=433724 RepID=A0A5J4SLN7_9ZZZZ